MRRALAIALVACVATTAVADDRKQAEVHVKQGVVYFKAAQYDDAIAEWKKAYELDKQSKTLFNIANAFYKKADYAGAVEYFQQYLAVDPDGPYAAQALEFSSDAKRRLAEVEAKRVADEQQAHDAAERDRLAKEAAQRELATNSHVAQAHAFENAGAWASAGDEYRGAAESSSDPEYLLQAAAAYRKQPALDKARDAYRAYLDKVPAGGHSDDTRAQLAAVTRELEAPPVATPQVATAPAATVATASGPPRAPRQPLRWLVSASGGWTLTGPQPVAQCTGSEIITGATGAAAVSLRYLLREHADLNVSLGISAASLQGISNATGLSTRCLGIFSGSLLAVPVTALLRWRPGAWFVGIGPELGFLDKDLSGTITPPGGAMTIDQKVSQFVVGGAFEVGRTIGSQETWEVGLHIVVAATPNAQWGSGQNPGYATLSINVGYAFK